MNRWQSGSFTSKAFQGFRRHLNNRGMLTKTPALQSENPSEGSQNQDQAEILDLESESHTNEQIGTFKSRSESGFGNEETISSSHTDSGQIGSGQIGSDHSLSETDYQINTLNTQTDSILTSDTSKTMNPEVASSRVLPKQSTYKKYSFIVWFFTWLLPPIASSGLGVWAFLQITQVPPAPDCQAGSAQIEEIAKFYCAQQAASSGNLQPLVAAVKLAKNWPPDHPRYSEVRHSLKEWSTSILLIARQKAGQDDLETAVKIASEIPPNSPVYKEAQAAIATWEKDWDQGRLLYEQAQAALKSQNWRQATAQAEAISRLSNNQWRARVNDLKKQIAAEKLAREHLEEARYLAQLEGPDSLAEAIKVAQKIDLNRYARNEAQAEVVRWSRQLLNLAIAKFEQNSLEDAIAIIELVPEKTALFREANQFKEFVQVQQLVTLHDPFKTPVYEQIWNVLSALETAGRVKPQTSFYKQIQRTIPQWQEQLEDLKQLQIATLVASPKQIPTYQLAIQQAGKITIKRPQRLQAQTLIAYWHKEIERLQDTPFLTRAQALAAAGTKPKLEAAIAEASRIGKGRVLRPEAQAEIARWQRQLEILEDQPILDKARNLAKQKQFLQAIQIAEQITSERILYQEAQDAIQEWVIEVEIAEDRNILEEAKLLASGKNYQAAIDTAARIGPDRPLYSEAQIAILDWIAAQEALQPPPVPESFPEDVPTEVPQPETESFPVPSPAGAPAQE